MTTQEHHHNRRNGASTTAPTGTGTTGDVRDSDQGWKATASEIESERALLGAMMMPLHVTRDGIPQAISSPAIIEARRVVDPDHFSDFRNQVIAAAIYGMADRGVRGIEPAQVVNELARLGQLTQAGGNSYLMELVTKAATATNAGWHADVVRAGANRRATYAYAQRVAQTTIADMESAELFERITGLHERWRGEVSPGGNTDLVSAGNRGDLLTDLITTWGQPDARGMTTGLFDLDTRLNIAPGSVVIIAGRPGSGKSILASRIAWHYVSERGEPVLYHSMEMPCRELMERDLARSAGIRLDSASGKTQLNARETQRLEQAAHQYQHLASLLFYDDTADLTMSHVEARYEEVKAITGPPSVVVIDYIQQMKTTTGGRGRDVPRHEAIGEISRRAKVFALRTGCIVVLVAQLNRGPESRPNGVPNIADLRESGNLEQDADGVILVYPVADYVEDRQGEVDLIIAKQRRGGHGITVPVADYRAYADFRDLTRRPEPSRAAVDDMPDLDNPGASPDRNGDDWWDK